MWIFSDLHALRRWIHSSKAVTRRSSGSATLIWNRSSCAKGFVIGYSKNRALPNLIKVLQSEKKMR